MPDRTGTTAVPAGQLPSPAPETASFRRCCRPTPKNQPSRSAAAGSALAGPASTSRHVRLATSHTRSLHTLQPQPPVSTPTGTPTAAKRRRETSAHSHDKQQQHKQSELALCVVWWLKQKDQLTRADLLPTKAHQQLRQSTQPSGGAASPSAAPLLGVSSSWPRLQPSSAPAYRTSERVRAPGGKPQCARTSFRNCTNRLTQCRWVPKAPPDAAGCPWSPLCAT